MKKIIILLILLCITLIISSCNINSSVKDAGAFDDNNDKQTQDVEHISSIHQIGSPEGADADDSSSLGYYRLAPIFDNSLSILYTDYETNTEMFLCARPECTHDNETCQSYVDITAGNAPGIMVNNDKLLIVSPGPVDDLFKPRVEIMDLDGTNRHLVAEFLSNQNIGTGRFCADAENLYFFLEDIESDGSYTRTLSSLNLFSGELSKYAQFDPYDHILDGTDNCLYIQCYEIEYDFFGQVDPFSTESYDDMFQVSKYKVEKYDLHDKKISSVCEEWSDKRYATMLDGVYYYYDPVTRKIFAHDLQTDTKNEVEVPGEYAFEYPYMQTIVDGKLIVGAFIDDKMQNRSLFAVDFINNQITAMPFSNSMGRSVMICGTFENRVFIQYDFDIVSYRKEIDGVMTEFTRYTDKIGYLTFNDFFSGKANYVSTEMIN